MGSTFSCNFCSLLVLLFLPVVIGQRPEHLSKEFRRLNRSESEKLQQECGKTAKSNRKLQFRISYGNRARQGQFPWAVQIIIDYEDYFAFCTGTVISSYHIITSAHCFIRNKLGIYNKILSGSYVLGGSPCAYWSGLNSLHYNNCSSPEYTNPLKVGLRRLIIPKDSLSFGINEILHKTFKKPIFYEGSGCAAQEYNTRRCESYAFDKLYSNYSDIAILEVLEPFPDAYEETIKPICTPLPEEPVPSKVCVYGFGATESVVTTNDSKTNMQLRWFETSRISDYSKCKSLTAEKFCERVIFVVNEIRNSTTICSGDSGGGLSGTVNGKYYIFGISSKGLSFCEEPEVFNKQNYYFWTVKTSVKHDFICYYTGICPMGYDKYLDPNYPEHPEPAAYVSDGKGPPYIGLGDVLTKASKKHR